MPDTRISSHMTHAGILVGPLEPAMSFYCGVLGGKETWRGSRDSKQLSWVNVKFPETEDYVEFMLYSELPAPDKRGKQHHLCLVVPDVEKAKALLEPRAARIGYMRSMDIATGVNRKRQLMEPRTVDGLPAASSTAPPPK